MFSLKNVNFNFAVGEAHYFDRLYLWFLLKEAVRK